MHELSLKRYTVGGFPVIFDFQGKLTPYVLIRKALFQLHPRLLQKLNREYQYPYGLLKIVNVYITGLLYTPFSSTVFEKY